MSRYSRAVTQVEPGDDWTRCKARQAEPMSKELLKGATREPVTFATPRLWQLDRVVDRVGGR
jgi:hypothetical protein